MSEKRVEVRGAMMSKADLEAALKLFDGLVIPVAPAKVRWAGGTFVVLDEASADALNARAVGVKTHGVVADKVLFWGVDETGSLLPFEATDDYEVIK